MRTVLLISVIFLCAACSGGQPAQDMKSAADGPSTVESGLPGSETSSKSNSVDSGKSVNDTGSLKSPANPSAGLSPELLKAMEEVAEAADQTIEDGWFFGQESRTLKSYYRKLSPREKAEFAAGYHEWLESTGQDMVKDFKSYVPYSKRADFAFAWWQEHYPKFKSEILKMQVLWAHESILDAGELYFRATEKLNAKNIDSIHTIAHDEEQKMIAHFCEHEGAPGRISDQIWKREHK